MGSWPRVTYLVGILKDMCDERSSQFQVGFGGVAGVRSFTEWADAASRPDALGASADDVRGVIARGAGCAYGDAAQRGGGTVVRIAKTPHEPSGATSDAIEVSAGATIGEVCWTLLRHGRFLPVVPGTARATIGGAIAADVHGKNHPHAGSFGAHVVSLDLIDGSGTRRRLSKTEDPEAFWATVGGMGLTGVIVSATLNSTTVGSALVWESTALTASIDETVRRVRALSTTHDHVAAWLDLRSRAFGTGVVTAANHLHGSLPREDCKARASSSRLVCPNIGLPLLGPRRVALANAAKIVSARRRTRRAPERLLGIESALWPLDGLGEWNRLYGKAGFVQYQVAIPDGAEGALVQLATDLGRLPVYLATLKRLGTASAAPLSFPLPGWTLALDVPATAPGLWAALDTADGTVAEVGGRVYLAKDVRLKARHVRAMYPRLDEWREVRARLDPSGRMKSDLGCRLGLIGSAT